MKRVPSIIGILVLLSACAWAGWLLYEGGHLSRSGLVALAERSGPWAPLILMGLMVLAVVIGPIPTVPISIASGVVFGALPGFLYAMVGALCGAAISFWIARIIGQPFMQRFFKGHIAFCETCSTRLLFWVVLGARLVPVVSFALVSYGAGLTAIRPLAFLLATAIGMVPMTILYVAVGASLTVAPLTAAIGGAVVVGLTLALPPLVEHFNPMGLHDRLRQHGSRPSSGEH